MPLGVWPRPEVMLEVMVGLKLQTGCRQHSPGAFTRVHCAGRFWYSGHLTHRYVHR